MRCIPGMGWLRIKAMQRRQHRRALAEIGPCALHRRSFAPVRGVDPDAEMDEHLGGAAV